MIILFERNLVRNFLPSITVPELPNDPSYFKKYLSVSSYFETTFFSKDDKKEEVFYIRKKKIGFKKTSYRFNKYLETLQMKGEIKSFQKVDMKRIEQLINKSNQFNLTTKRYSFADLKEISSNKKFITFQLRLSDIYGETGLLD